MSNNIPPIRLDQNGNLTGVWEWHNDEWAIVERRLHCVLACSNCGYRIIKTLNICPCCHADMSDSNEYIGLP